MAIASMESLVARVIVVDDEQAVAEVCAMLLRTNGNDVLVAYDGETAVRMIRELLPDVVVSDVRMPGIGGHELVSLLKAQPATAKIPVLLVSGHDNAAEKPCDAFLSKPFAIAELLATVRRLAMRSTAESAHR